jgi:hypothetical protein
MACPDEFHFGVALETPDWAASRSSPELPEPRSICHASVRRPACAEKAVKQAIFEAISPYLGEVSGELIFVARVTMTLSRVLPETGLPRWIRNPLV